MNHLTNYQKIFKSNGFAIAESIYSPNEIEEIISTISETDQSNDKFRKTDDVFAIRQFLREVPQVKSLIFNTRLKSFINDVFGTGYFVVKSIYFDKPEKSNWFVSWHQDLTIAVNSKTETEGYSRWTVKPDCFAVQPPIDVLQNNFTIRIHLDDTDECNGALKIITGSHLKDVYRPETINWKTESETICRVRSGGIMIMRPLLLHASNRTITNKRRRVIHVEFSKEDLPRGICWAEKQLY